MHAPALAALRNLSRPRTCLYLFPRTCSKFWAVATRRIEDNGLGLSVAEAKAEIGKLKNAFALFLDSTAAAGRVGKVGRCV